MKSAISSFISLCLTALLYFGGENIHEFAFYIIAVTSASCWIILFFVGINRSAALSVLNSIWWTIPVSLLQIAAMVATGHTVFAATSFICSVILIFSAFKELS